MHDEDSQTHPRETSLGWARGICIYKAPVADSVAIGPLDYLVRKLWSRLENLHLYFPNQNITSNS